MKRGILYGIGVGPGDPDLVTIKATHILKQADIVFAAASSRNDHSHALTIARPYLAAHARVCTLPFPMTRNTAELEDAWNQNARIVADCLHDGQTGVFLTLGDPLIYSTFGYLMRTLERDFPDVTIRIIPGVTSFQAAAALTQTVLCEAEENLLVISGIAGETALEQALSVADNAVILKAYKGCATIRNAVRKKGKEKGAFFASGVGTPGETVVPLEDAPAKLPYLSLILIGHGGKKPRQA